MLRITNTITNHLQNFSSLTRWKFISCLYNNLKWIRPLGCFPPLSDVRVQVLSVLRLHFKAVVFNFNWWALKILIVWPTLGDSDFISLSSSLSPKVFKIPLEEHKGPPVFREGAAPRQWFPVHGLQTGSISNIWELVRLENSWIPNRLAE